MPISADTLRLASVFETTRGQTPTTTPSWDIQRVTGEGLTFNPTATFSNEMDATRNVRDSILTGGEVSGDINFELSWNAPWQDLLSSVMCNNWGSIPAGVTGNNHETGPDDDTDRPWGADDLFVGSSLKTYTFEKRFKLDGPGFVYHRYNGCLMNTFSLTVTPNEPISGSFGVLGSGLTLGTGEIAGSTYESPGSEPVFTALKVTDISMYSSTAGDMRFDDYCFNSVTLNINNNARRTACIGPDTLSQVVLGRCEITWDMNVYFADNKILQWLQEQQDVVIIMNLRDTAQPSKHKYIFRSGRCKPQTGSVVASGTGQDVIANMTFAALIPLGASEPLGSLTISRETLDPGEG